MSAILTAVVFGWPAMLASLLTAGKRWPGPLFFPVAAMAWLAILFLLQ